MLLLTSGKLRLCTSKSENYSPVDTATTEKSEHFACTTIKINCINVNYVVK